MKPQTTTEEIDSVIADISKALKENMIAKANLIKNELEVKRTHNEVVMANNRLHDLMLDTY